MCIQQLFYIAAINPCLSSPCFIDHKDPSLQAECTYTGPGSYTCGPCPLGMTGSGERDQGCQGMQACRVANCCSVYDNTYFYVHRGVMNQWSGLTQHQFSKFLPTFNPETSTH